MRSWSPSGSGSWALRGMQPERSLSCALEWVPFSLMYLGVHITYIYLVTRAPKREAASFNSVAGAVGREALSALPPSPGGGQPGPEGMAGPQPLCLTQRGSEITSQG